MTDTITCTITCAARTWHRRWRALAVAALAVLLVNATLLVVGLATDNWFVVAVTGPALLLGAYLTRRAFARTRYWRGEAATCVSGLVV